MSDTTKVKTHYAGKLDHKCSGCDALFYRGEAKRGVDGSYGPCCSCGAVSSPSTYDDFPRSVYELLKWEHPLSADFHRHVRNYNSSLSLASISCNLDRRYTGPCGPYCFRIHGNVYTLFNNGTYAEGVPSYAQLYVVNSEQAMDYRMQHPANHGINRGLLQSLDEEIRAINPHAQSYQMLRAVEEAAAEYQRQQAEVLRANGMEVEEAETASYKLLFKLPGNVDRRLYNIPRANEIAAVFRTDADGSIPPAELIIHSGNGRTYRLSTLSSLVAPFTFPLLFPIGREGWTPMLPLARPVKNRRHVPRRNDRQGNVVFNPLHHAGKLFQEYVVIIYVHVEGDRLEWVRANQDELRANDYRGLHTMTCNPSWQEITESLGVKPSGTPINASTRPDLVARVFYLKPKRLIADIKGTASAPGCSGKLKNFVYTIGYQKCGLPHMHMLTTLDEQSKLKTAENIDKGYPLCRRRQDGREFVYGSGQSPRRADNRWIVPYCPALLKKYSCHMNVEIVQGLHAVKYLYKYIFKGFDRACMELSPTDTVL